MSRIVTSLVATLVCACTLPALAQGYPSRPVRMIMPFAPGGAGDFVARILQPRMSELLGQQVIVDNRPGAAGNIGVEIAANATADGHTILLGNIGAMAINPHLYTKFPVNTQRDFIAVSQVVDVPGALAVHPSVPAKSAGDLVALLKAKPNALNFGSPGGGSANRLEMELFLMRTGTRMVHVPYKGGAGPATTALLGNEVQAMFVTFSSVIQHAKSGRLRLLGVVAPERLAPAPDIPTMREQGHAELMHGSWQGIYTPKGTPRAVVDRLFDVTTRTMAHAEVARRLADGGVSVVASKSPAEFAAFMKSENERFARMIREAKITLD